MQFPRTRSLALRAIPIAALTAAIAVGSVTTPALAWSNCGTPQAEADCAAHGLPGAPTPAPTVAPAPPAPSAPVAASTNVASAPSTTSSAASAPSNGGAISTLPIFCHFEPTTGNWEMRHESQPQAGDRRPNSAGLCGMGEAVSVTRSQPAAAAPKPAPTVAPAPPVLAASAPNLSVSSPVLAAPPAAQPTPAPTPPPAPTPVAVLGETLSAPAPEAQQPTVPEDLAAPNTGDSGLVTDLQP